MGSVLQRVARMSCARRLTVSAVLAATAAIAFAGCKAPSKPIFESDSMVIRDISEIDKAFRPPTVEEIAKLGPFWPKGPEEENAAHWFALAASKLDTNDPPAGSADAISKPYAGDIAAFEKWVEGNRPALKMLREGLKRKTLCAPVVVFAPSRGATFDLHYFGHLRELGRILTDAGFLEELKGRPDAAAEEYLDGIRFGMTVRLQPTVIGELVGVSVSATGAGMLERLVAGRRLTDETLAAVIAECRRAEVGQKEPQAAWDLDMAFTEAVMAIHGDNPGQREWFQAWHRFSATMKDILAKRTLDELLQQKLWKELYAHELKEFGPDNKDGFPSQNLWITNLGLLNVMLRATATRAAIILYERRNKKLPDRLDELVPGILAELPIDPFAVKSAANPAGVPMEYHRTETGWKLRSVGESNAGDNDDSTYWWYRSESPSNLEKRSAGRSPDGKDEKGNPTKGTRR